MSLKACQAFMIAWWIGGIVLLWKGFLPDGFVWTVIFWLLMLVGFVPYWLRNLRR